MTWRVEFDDTAAKELHKLGKQAQQEILRYFRERIATNEDPRRFGKPLSRELVSNLPNPHTLSMLNSEAIAMLCD